MSVYRGSTRRRHLFLSRVHPGPKFCSVCKTTHVDSFEDCNPRCMIALSLGYIPFMIRIDGETTTDEEEEAAETA